MRSGDCLRPQRLVEALHGRLPIGSWTEPDQDGVGWGYLASDHGTQRASGEADAVPEVDGSLRSGNAAVPTT